MPPITVALDWTPNINHAGFFVALQRGYFEARGLDVSFISPHVDDYKTTPARRLAAGEVNVAICPSESIISYACQVLQGDGNGGKLTAIAAVLAQDTSAIVALQSSGIKRPRDLDGKTYASYGARYEGRIVQQMIKNDGGSGDYTEDTSTGMLGIMQGLREGNADATWVFMGWEGVQAQRDGVELNAFSLDDYKVPYGYTPVLAAREQSVASPHEKIVLRRFLEAADLGWRAVAEDPATAAREATAAMNAAFPDLPEAVDEGLMVAAAEYVAPHVLSSGAAAHAAHRASRSVSIDKKPRSSEESDGGPIWGVMEEGRWAAFLDWLSEAGLLTHKRNSRVPKEPTSTSLDELRAGNAGSPVQRERLPAAQLFTNALLPMVAARPDAASAGARHSKDVRKSE